MEIVSLMKNRRPIKIVLFIALLVVPVLFSTNIVLATELPKPTEKVLLKITGNISNTNVEGEAWFDLKMLKDIGETTILTETLWTSGVSKFTGVLLKNLLNAAGAQSKDFEAIASNKYKFKFADIDYEKYPVIVAWELDSELLTVRTLGPLWVMVPFNEIPEADRELYVNAAVWQLIELVVY